ncbi:MAG: undecaprenyl-diphosphate phosphatase [Eubacteriaceae bacterium]|nr:undecaprenyl-diphosphate phosphatase [Eubacteriaceae bacterium]
MNIVDATFLGILQGLTEILPVSSSGHLVIARHFMKLDDGNLLLNCILHLGTLAAICIVYSRSILNMIKEFFLMIWDFIAYRSLNVYKNKYRKTIVLIIISTIPFALISLLFESKFKELFSSIEVVSITLIFTGILLALGEKIGKKNQMHMEKLTLKNSLIIGLLQSVAIIPGISRTGAAIAGGLISGLKKEEAAEFSFLMSVPVILGALLVRSTDIMALKETGIAAITLGTAFTAAVLFGIFAIQLLSKLLRNGKLYYFSYYCWGVSALLLINSYVR